MSIFALTLMKVYLRENQIDGDLWGKEKIVREWGTGGEGRPHSTAQKMSPAGDGGGQAVFD